MKRLAASGLLLLALLLGACDGDPSDAPSADAAPLVDAGPSDYPADRIGSVALVEALDTTGTGLWNAVHAELFDRPEVPLPARVAQSGDCSVWVRPGPGQCDPACTDGACVAPGTCVPWQEPRSAGTITVTGLLEPLSFVPTPFGYDVMGPDQSEPIFTAGATVTVAAAGADVPAFTAMLPAPEPLQAPFQNVVLVDGVDHDFTWTAPTTPTIPPHRIQLALLVGWHGAPFEAMLLCETADDGALTIPGALIAQLPRASSSLESHPSWLLRFARANVPTSAGPIEVLLGSRVYVHFGHP